MSTSHTNHELQADWAFRQNANEVQNAILLLTREVNTFNEVMHLRLSNLKSRVERLDKSVGALETRLKLNEGA
ncbi:MAG: hypothetical protein EZS28_023722 [Streblomastix strix]|uniref:Uncharacterized protein n=1 Tax=Streblomastix strix TaxID=222440 RepID=A0A5J4VE42_9EUKA|nr:MAG: hypothetical protein EZS28_023722 [Streblomastix strix]